MIKRAIFLFFISIFSVGTFAQSDGKPAQDVKSISRQLQKIKWDMNLGMSYSFIPGYGGAMNKYIAPGFSYPVANRVAFHGGIISGFSSPSGSIFGGQDNTKMNPRYSSGFTSIYGSVSYQASQNVIFYGTGVKNIARYGLMHPLSYPSFDEISIGSTIRLGNNITVGASVHFRDYQYPGNSFDTPFFNY